MENNDKEGIITQIENAYNSGDTRTLFRLIKTATHLKQPSSIVKRIIGTDGVASLVEEKVHLALATFFGEED